MNADGSNQINVTRNAAADLNFTWSSDGEKIAFTSDRDGNSEIYIMNADGSNQERLTGNSASDRTPVWSSDGEKIAFTSCRDGNLEIYVMDSDGGDQKNVTRNDAHDLNFTWSPDGAKIAFVSPRNGAFEIYITDGGRTFENITKNSAWNWSPVWSPDGEKITYISSEYWSSGIYIMNSDGGNQKRLTTTENSGLSTGSTDVIITFYSCNNSIESFQLDTFQITEGRICDPSEESCSCVFPFIPQEYRVSVAAIVLMVIVLALIGYDIAIKPD